MTLCRKAFNGGRGEPMAPQRWGVGSRHHVRSEPCNVGDIRYRHVAVIHPVAPMSCRLSALFTYLSTRPTG
eukprot:CAMPEP_0174749204 /NCGR_PEP_ID=MMETSP1094-20130205/95173_1 /TAXON_ID=156173 /ORGANISM="Chrysochromulina brevifilum, Strain UTEX LB 985" /LENGTH=70 /DNA_ID=CAMNT_0015954373 /DNA_START=215 /DNA_END=427 /DNA_ORIENTATION=-